MTEKKFKCKICDRSFHSEAGLKEHPLRYHVFKAALIIVVILAVFVALVQVYSATLTPTKTLTTYTPPPPTTTIYSSTAFETAPDFTLPVFGSNKTLRLSDMIGRPVLLEFFSPYCPHCLNMMPTIEELYERYGDRMEFILITFTEDKIQEIIREYGLKATILIDSEADVFKSYNVRGVPSYFILDRGHRIVVVLAGEMPGEELEEYLVKALG